MKPIVYFEGKRYELIFQKGDNAFIKDLETEEVQDVNTEDIELVEDEKEFLEKLTQDAIEQSQKAENSYLTVAMGLHFLNWLLTNEITSKEVLGSNMDFTWAVPLEGDKVLCMELYIGEIEEDAD